MQDVVTMLRQPIVTVLGHVDHGKTSLLDTIRQTAIASGEAGGITQAIGTTEVPIDVVKGLCGHLADKFRFEFAIPGVLFIDTPGHEAFTTLRRRGGSIADLAVLVVDINEGLMPQTVESIDILRESKVPFVVAANKIDRIQGWKSSEMCCFLENYPSQSDEAKAALEEKFYRLVEQLASYGFVAERFDRVADFTKTIAAVPVSCKTGEGVPELLTILAGLAQQFLKDRLTTTEKGRGIILEVKELTGLGMTIDAIIYDGVVNKNDFLVIGGKSPRISKIRAMLVPEPMRDIRVEKKFASIEECRAAKGIKISAPGLDDVIAGSEIRTAKTLEEAESLLDELESREHVEIATEGEGLILKAETLGSLEALISVFKEYPIKEASIGQVSKQDAMKAESNADIFSRAIIGFNTKLPEDVEQFAKDKNIKIIASDVIYRLKEEYEEWVAKEKEATKKREIESIARAGKIRLLPGCIFRASNPAIVGCEVLGGIIKPGYKLLKEYKEIGEIKQIQNQGQNVDSATISDKVAVSIIGPTVGRQIDESDILYTDLSGDDYKRLIKNEKLLTEHEKKVLEEIVELKRKQDRMWGY